MIGVVVTAYNEQDSIEEVIDTIPPYVDRIYVVDDASTDNTPRILAKMTSNHIRLVVINFLLVHVYNFCIGCVKSWKHISKDRCKWVKDLMRINGKIIKAFALF